jgi:hypothetical protein
VSSVLPSSQKTISKAGSTAGRTSSSRPAVASMIGASL